MSNVIHVSFNKKKDDFVSYGTSECDQYIFDLAHDLSEDDFEDFILSIEDTRESYKKYLTLSDELKIRVDYYYYLKQKES